jgi:hypothetical protein
MHYRNGREAKNGDMVVQINWDGKSLSAFGVLHSALPGNDYCNGMIAPVISNGACLIDCLHVEDVMALIEAAGLAKRPEGK